jgi:hypothetical protein
MCMTLCDGIPMPENQGFDRLWRKKRQGKRIFYDQSFIRETLQSCHASRGSTAQDDSPVTTVHNARMPSVREVQVGGDFVTIVKSILRGAGHHASPPKSAPRTPMALPNTFDSAASAGTALGNFLRGIERRAALLAELQCGDQMHGDRALAAAIESFAVQAPGMPQDGWPLQFWTTLLQTPVLNAEPVAPYWNGDFASLARLDFGTRAVLLLRVVAGLDDGQASAVFGVDATEFKQALQRALPQREDGSLDGEAWLALNDEARFVIKHMPPERVAAIARLRDGAVAATLVDAASRGPQLGKSGWLGRLWPGRS